MPDKGTAKDEVGELLTNVSVPENVPAVVGAKLTVHEALAPGAIVSGIVRPEYEKPVPDMEACVIVKLAVPGLEIVSVCVLLTPLLTLPKLTDAGLGEICG